MRAATYLRVSSREQVDGYSIPAQREACLRLIADNGWTLAEEFCDSGESARTSARPEFQALLTTLAEKPIDVLVVHKLDRLARNLEDHVAVRANLRKLGVRLVSVTEGFEENASGQLVEGIMASIAEFYSANLAQEVKKGMTEKARRGGWPTSAPVGYRNVRMERESRQNEAIVIPDPEQAPLVKRAFELYATGDWAIRDLQIEMEHQGLRGRRGGKISRSRLAEMLHNPFYIGKVVWDGVESHGIHEPLVSEAVFEKVQEVFRLHDRAGVRRFRDPHYLRGTVYCGSCGSRMSSLTAKRKYTYFYCIGGHTERTDCDEPYIRVEELEKLVANLYRDVELAASEAETIRTEIDKEVSRRRSEQSRSRPALTKQLTRLETERSKLLKAYYADAITLDQLKGEQERLNSEESRVHHHLTVTDDHIDAATKLAHTALTFATSLDQAYGAAGSEEARQKRNQAVFSALYVSERAIVGAEYQWPFEPLLKANFRGSNKNRQVDLTGLKLLQRNFGK